MDGPTTGPWIDRGEWEEAWVSAGNLVLAQLVCWLTMGEVHIAHLAYLLPCFPSKGPC